MLLPYKLESLHQERPWLNYALIVATVLVSLMGLGAEPYSEVGRSLRHLVLRDWDLRGLLGHMFLHVGLGHLVGNMIALYVFGGVVCGNIRNLLYLPVYLLLGVAAGAIHLVFDGNPTIGASGAISGLVGLCVALYPTNRMHFLWWLLVRGGTFAVPMWVLALVWFTFDILDIVGGAAGVAAWAHLGGTVVGVGLGFVLLRTGLVTLTQYDNPTLFMILAGGSGSARPKPGARRGR